MNLCIYSTHSFTKEYMLSIFSLARPKYTSSKHKGYSTKSSPQGSSHFITVVLNLTNAAIL